MRSLQRAEGISHRGLALEAESSSGVGLGRLVLMSLNWCSSPGELWVKLGTPPLPALTTFSVTPPDSERRWTATPVTRSVPVPDPLASAGGHVSACCPRPAPPVLYRPPLNRNNDLLVSRSPLCTPGPHSLSTGQRFTSLSRSALGVQLHPVTSLVLLRRRQRVLLLGLFPGRAVPLVFPKGVVHL